MRIASKSWAVLIVLAVAQSTYGATTLVDSVGALDPNPSSLTITEVGNTSLATAKALIAAAHTAGNGGTLDFQQKFQGGTFPNSNNATNGVDFGAGPLNLLSATASNDGAGNATGPVIFSFYRLESDGAGANNTDSNLNQGSNIISGGYKSRDPIAAGTAVNGLVDLSTVPPTPDPATNGTSVSGGYIGITGLASPATLVFSNGLSFFGITALPRSATRDTLITLTETPIAGGAPISVPIGAATVVGANAVFFGQAANAGFTITSAAITNPNGQGQNRYDDLAFIVAVPEPSSLALIGLGGLGILVTARRRLAIRAS